MAICRWSSNNFNCDLYAYESAQGFELHVARSRLAHDLPPMPPFPIKGATTEEIDAWVKANNEHSALIEKAELVPIELKHAGQSFTFGDAEDAARFVGELRKLGYNIPDDVEECLLEDVE